jgi:UDP-GlcNAc:undecaprenyl-phosphate GlcNAc-1-phosphate transferase
VDLVLAVFRRVSAGQSPFAADRKHLHHRLLDIGHSKQRAVLIMYLWAFVIAFGSISLAFVPWATAWPVLAFVAVGSLALTMGPLRGGRLRRRL